MAVKPNLPYNSVSKVVMSDSIPTLNDALRKYGVEVISTERIKAFLPFEQTHADMQFLPINEYTAAVLSNANVLAEKLKKLYKTFIKIPLSNNVAYPENVLLNHTIIGNYIIGNKRAVPSKLYNIFINNGFKFVNVRQGYCKCSTAVVTDNAVITSDETIFKACTELKMDVLRIKAGHIILPGTDYGFIGGCCGKLSEKILAFTGDIDLHPDGKSIKSFCGNYGIDTLSLSKDPLIDIGGIIPVE